MENDLREPDLGINCPLRAIPISGYVPLLEIGIPASSFGTSCYIWYEQPPFNVRLLFNVRSSFFQMYFVPVSVHGQSWYKLLVTGLTRLTLLRTHRV